ncbi:MAG TPA: DUF3300 domain-containing protein [Stellaceae bacterium]|nr:DUF3300 domain-containing protein [Stellaceae bacterium]
MTSFRLRIMAQVLPFLLLTPGLALAAPPSPGEAAAALGPAANPAAVQYTRAQIDQMVAPIALYPDQLLTQVLMAATYPQQIVDAAQWLQDPANAALKGDALVAALQPLPWDPSVKALVPFPQLIVMLSEHIDWTQTLGVAFATQQPAVMARVQALRHLAFKAGRLKALHHLVVREEGTAIVIMPAEADQMFVPVYNPMIVYGEWPDRGFPPVYVPPPPGFIAETIEPGLEFGVGYGIVAPLWGWSQPDWRADRITVNRSDYTRITRDAQIGPGDTWRHSGPVVLAAPAAESRSRTTAAAGPAGTVAPAAAAAVVGLPQRAARQPAQIQTGHATTGATPGARTGITTAQPGTTRPGTTPPASHEAATAKPEPSKSATAPTGGATIGNRSRSTESGAAASRRPITEPGKTQATGAEPRAEPTNHAPLASHSPTVQPNRGEAATTTPPAERRPEQMRAGAPAVQRQPHETAAPMAAPRPPEHAGMRAEPGVPPQGAARPAAQSTEHAVAPHGAIGQGSTMPPAAAAPPHAAPAPRGHETAGPHPAARPDETNKDKKE